MTSNRIIYILSFVVSVILFVFTGSPYAMVLAGVFVVLAVLFAIGVFVQASFTQIHIEVAKSLEVGNRAYIQIDLVRGLPFSLALIVFDIECASLTFDTVATRKTVLALNTLAKSSVQIPLDARRYGRMSISITNSVCADPLGLFRCKLDVTNTSNCIVYPEDYALTTNIRSVPLSRAFGKTYDESKSGSDVDEVFDVREFREGDHLASVHWKLSARFNSMMSREFSRPVDFELIVVNLTSLHGIDNAPIDPDLLNGVAATGIAISRDFLNLNLSHNYALPLNGVLTSELVDSLDSFTHATELMLTAPIAETYADAVSALMVSELAANFTKCILVTPVYDENLWSQLSVEMNLSVILIVNGSGANEVEGDYDLIVIDTEDVQNYERCITL